MKQKKKSAVSWILIWAGQKRIAYVWSVLLAIGNVIFKIFPYFIIHWLEQTNEEDNDKTKVRSEQM